MLLSKRYRAHRLTVRYDRFRVGDLDQGHSTAENGDAVTVAYTFESGLRQRIGIEYTTLDSNRRTYIPTRLSQQGWQVSYRFRY